MCLWKLIPGDLRWEQFRPENYFGFYSSFSSVKFLQSCIIGLYMYVYMYLQACIICMLYIIYMRVLIETSFDSSLCLAISCSCVIYDKPIWCGFSQDCPCSTLGEVLCVYISWTVGWIIDPKLELGFHWSCTFYFLFLILVLLVVRCCYNSRWWNFCERHFLLPYEWMEARSWFQNPLGPCVTYH